MKENVFLADLKCEKVRKRGCFALLFRLNLRVKLLCLCIKVIDFTREKYSVWL